MPEKNLNKWYNKEEIDKIERLWDDYLNVIWSVKEDKKRETYEILNLWNTIEIIEYINYHYKNNKKLFEFLKSTVKLDLKRKKKILKYLIKKWYTLYYSYSEIVWIDIKDISIELISEWFIEFVEFVYIKELKENFSREDILKVIELYYSFFDNLEIKSKLYILIKYDWNEILKKLSFFLSEKERNEIDLNIRLTTYEKNIIKNEKINWLYNEYNENIYLHKEVIESSWFSIFDTISYIPTFSYSNNDKKLEEALQKILILKNWWNFFNIDFITITWDRLKFSFEPFLKTTNSRSNIFYDFEYFKREVIKLNNHFKRNLQNEIDYTIIISKWNWNKKPSPIDMESVNDDFIEHLQTWT